METTAARVVGYVRVSTGRQGEAGNGLEAQREAIERECLHRGWTLVRIEQDVMSGKSTRNRPGLERALGAVEGGEASALVVAKLDRLSRSLIDFATLVERSRERGWEIVVLDLHVDTTTPNGEAMAGMLAVFAQWERRIIGERTKSAMAVVKKRTHAERQKLGKKKVGRPARVVPDEIRRRIRRERKAGLTYRAIAARLEADRVPTGGRGARWYASAVQRLA
jgi:DNA invertase Pin-like site-specific DNA recombinase